MRLGAASPLVGIRAVALVEADEMNRMSSRQAAEHVVRAQHAAVLRRIREVRGEEEDSHGAPTHPYLVGANGQAVGPLASDRIFAIVPPSAGSSDSRIHVSVRTDLRKGLHTEIGRASCRARCRL